MAARKDFTQIALDVVRQATGETVKLAPTPKQVAASKAGKAGGASRMENMTPEQRRELALKAAGARWGKEKAPVPTQGATGGRKR